MAKLTKLLVESVARVEIGKLTRRVAALEEGARSGRLGPRTVRARGRFLEKDRKRLVFILRKWGYEVEL
jgi:hypothetical protein